MKTKLCSVIVSINHSIVKAILLLLLIIENSYQYLPINQYLSLTAFVFVQLTVIYYCVDHFQFFSACVSTRLFNTIQLTNKYFIGIIIALAILLLKREPVLLINN